MTSNAGTDERKIYIRLVLDPKDPMDRAIIEAVKKQRKKKMSRFVKFAAFCYIKKVDMAALSPRGTNVRENPVKITKETDPAVTRAIKEIEGVEF